MEDHGIRLVNRLEVGELKVTIFHPEDTCGATIEVIEYKMGSQVLSFAFSRGM